MMLVGDVSRRTAILIDDLADTSNTITRAAKLLKKEGATKAYALITHGVLSGDAIESINKSALDKVVVTNSLPQEEHQQRCKKLEVLDIGGVFAEVCPKMKQLILKSWGFANIISFHVGHSTSTSRRIHLRALSV